jgi:hypothetical protein
MFNPDHFPVFARVLRLAFVLSFGISAAPFLHAATAEFTDPSKKSFDVPAGDAPVSLKYFAQQAGLELLYSAKEIAGAKTNAVKGMFTAREALTKMLSGTKLIATPGKSRGAVAVTRAHDPNG